MIYVKNFSAPEIDRCEILRYAGVVEVTAEINALLDECLIDTLDKLSYKACWREYNISRFSEGLDLGFAKTSSASLIKTLDGCDKIVVFCATVGPDIDRFIKKYSMLSPSRSVILQAIGTERVEALCDTLCGELAEKKAKENQRITRRLSPGYSDIPLENVVISSIRFAKPIA